MPMCRLLIVFVIFFFKQKTAYEMRISDWSSDVCSSDLCRFQHERAALDALVARGEHILWQFAVEQRDIGRVDPEQRRFGGVGEHVGGRVDPPREQRAVDLGLTDEAAHEQQHRLPELRRHPLAIVALAVAERGGDTFDERAIAQDRKSTRLNYSP